MRPIFFFQAPAVQASFLGLRRSRFRPSVNTEDSRCAREKTSGTVPRVVTKVLLLIVSFSHVSQSFLAKSVFCLYVLTVTKNSKDLGEKADCSNCKPGLEAVYFLAARFIKASSHATSHEPG